MALGWRELVVEGTCLCVYLRDRRRDKDALVKLQQASSTAAGVRGVLLSIIMVGPGALASAGWGTVVGGAASDLAGLFVF